MKDQRIRENLVQCGEYLGIFLDGIGFGLMIAYVVFASVHQLSYGVFLAGAAVTAIGSLLFAGVRRKRDKKGSVGSRNDA